MMHCYLPSSTCDDRLPLIWIEILWSFSYQWKPVEANYIHGPYWGCSSRKGEGTPEHDNNAIPKDCHDVWAMCCRLDGEQECDQPWRMMQYTGGLGPGCIYAENPKWQYFCVDPNGAILNSRQARVSSNSIILENIFCKASKRRKCLSSAWYIAPVWHSSSDKICALYCNTISDIE